jgi:hypothetical protein
MYLSLPARLTQTAAAYALLDVDEPLLRVLEQMTVRVEQSAIVVAILSVSVAALLAGVTQALVAVVAAAVAAVPLTASFAMLTSDRRACVRDLIIEGRGTLPLPVVQRERRRLLARTTRAELARSLETLREDASRRVRCATGAPPLYTPRVVVAVAVELQMAARLLDREQVSLSGVAMTERLLNAHNSPLYGRDPMLLREELHRITFVLGARDEPHGAAP